MELTFNGHACLTLRSAAGTVVVMDPYRSGALGGRIRHAPLSVRADVVTVSHWHVDHSHVTEALGTPEVVARSGHAAGIAFTLRPTYHDRDGGARMGLSSMTAFTLDGLRIAHLGDLGCDLTPDDVDQLGPVDILLWPTGGVYTVGPEDAPGILARLRPRLAIPIHYESAGCQLGLAPVDALRPHWAGPWVRPGVSHWSSADGLSGETTVMVLEPAL